MLAHWLIEEGVFPATAPRIIAALEGNGIAWTRYEDGMPGALRPPDGACVLFWGSLGAAYVERVAARWTPGAVGDVDRFRCSVYQPHLRPFLANPDSVVSTVRDLVSDPASVLRPLGGPDRVFVRPDSALKPFAGRQLAVADLSLAALDHGFYYDDEALPVVASTVKRIDGEWRFVVADGVVVAGCGYSAERRTAGTDVPASARALAEQVAGHAWQPAPLYVVDVGDVGGSVAVLELDPFSGADLYECDATAVVTAASDVAEQLHAARTVADASDEVPEASLRRFPELEAVAVALRELRDGVPITARCRYCREMLTLEESRETGVRLIACPCGRTRFRARRNPRPGP